MIQCRLECIGHVNIHIVCVGTGLKLSGVTPQLDIKKNLLEKFSEISSDPPRRSHGDQIQRRLTNKMRDKILLHLLVLTLIVDDFSVDCSILQCDLKVTTKKLVTLQCVCVCVCVYSNLVYRYIRAPAY